LFRRRRTFQYRNERLELPDGDFVDLCHTPATGGPIVVVLHGLEGNIASPYASAILSALAGQGWHGVLMHFRGCGGTVNRLDRAYHSGETGDIRFLIDTLHGRYPGAALAAVGYSLGGNALLKYLGEQGSGTHLKAAAAVSVPYLLQDSARRLCTGLSRLYQRRLVRSLHNKLRVKFAARAAPFDLKELHKLDTFNKFDEAVTAPLHGFASAEDYYKRSSSRQYLARIAVPSLLLHARDDPFMTPAVLPDANELSVSITLEVSEHGGHVGFVGGKFPWKPVYWLEQRIINYLRQYL
jgi:predicted alpha/beta-fold hydrolase